jgi:glutathione S-transferase
VSVAPVEIPTNVAAWLDRVRALPGFVDDFVTYPENARPGAGASIY